MSLSHNQSWHSRSSNSTSHSIPPLINIAPLVPLSPSFQRSKHSTSSTHITKSSLSTSVRTATSYPWDTRNSTSSSPTFSRSLSTCNSLYTMSLSSVLAQVGVHKVDQVSSDWSSENGWGPDL